MQRISGRKVKIYVQLLAEGTKVYRPAQALEEGTQTYRVIGTENYDPEDEQWELPPGSLVHGEMRTLNGHEVLVAVSASVEQK